MHFLSTDDRKSESGEEDELERESGERFWGVLERESDRNTESRLSNVEETGFGFGVLTL